MHTYLDTPQVKSTDRLFQSLYNEKEQNIFQDHVDQYGNK